MVTGVPGHELAATRAGGTGASAQGKRLYRSGPMLTLLSYQSTIRTSKPLSETPHSSIGPTAKTSRERKTSPKTPFAVISQRNVIRPFTPERSHER